MHPNEFSKIPEKSVACSQRQEINGYQNYENTVMLGITSGNLVHGNGNRQSIVITVVCVCVRAYI